MDVAEHLRAALAAAKVKQVDVARALGLTPKHINQILLGHVRPRTDLAQLIAAQAGYELVLIPAGHSCDSGHDLLERARLNTELAELKVDARMWETRAKAAEQTLARIRVTLKEPK